MNLLTKIILGVIALAIAFALGRYVAPDHTKIEDVQTDTTKEKEQDKHKVTVIVKAPDGTQTTTITEDTETRQKEVQKTVDKLYEEIKSRHNLINVSGLVGNDGFRSLSPIYGVSVSKEMIGPLTIGVWGMTNSTVGLSVGVNF